MNVFEEYHPMSKICRPKFEGVETNLVRYDFYQDDYNIDIDEVKADMQNCVYQFDETKKELNHLIN